MTPTNDHFEEQALIGATMVHSLGSGPYPVELEVLDVGHLRHPAHRLIWTAVAQLIAEGKRADSVSVSTVLRSWGKKDLGSYLTRLEADSPSSANLSWMAKRLIDAGRKRSLLHALNDIALRGASEETVTADQIASEAAGALRAADRGADLHGGLKHVSELIPGAVEAIKKQANHPEGGRAAMFGVRAIDRLLRMERGEVTLLGGLPGTGKTALVGQLCEYNAHQGGESEGAVALFELEMTALSLVRRSIQRCNRWSRDRLEMMARRDDLGDAVSPLSKLNLFIDDRAGLTMGEIRMALARLPKVRLCVIDYLQLIRLPKGRSSLEGLDEVSGDLKTLAKEMDCHMVVLAHLSSDVVKENRRPRMSDLRGSRLLEANADNVTFLYRDDYENPASKKPGVVEFMVAKHRNNRANTSAEVQFLEEFQVYADLGQKEQTEMELK